MACSFTGNLILIYIHRGKEGKKKSKYHLEIGATVVCIKMMVEETKRLDQRGVKWATEDCFIFGSWFSSKRLE